jgi:hypothetical protein
VRLLPAVTVDTYNEELRDDDGFVGDRASRRAFRAILADWRDRLKEHGDDPFGDLPMEEITKSKLDKLLVGDDPRMAGWPGRPVPGLEACRCHLGGHGTGAGDDLAEGPGSGSPALTPFRLVQVSPMGEWRRHANRGRAPGSLFLRERPGLTRGG